MGLLWRRGPEPQTPDEYKRWAYTIGLPLGALALLVAWFPERAAFSPTTFAQVAQPLLSALLLALTLTLTLKRITIRSVEFVLFTSLAVYFLLRLGTLLFSGDSPGVITDVAAFGFWFPLLYALTFFMFGLRRGRQLAWLLFAVSVGLSLVYLLTSPSTKWSAGVRVVGQMEFASALTIAVLTAFAKLSDIYSGLADTDTLTGLHNRRRLEALLQNEKARAERYQHTFSVLLLDLDHFKAVNDKHGHATGDEVLKRVAYLLRDETRSIDRVGRWGGEEFLVLAPELGMEEAECLAQRLCEAVALFDFGVAGPLTASFGVATNTPDDTIKTLLARADKALYQAKAEGRNRVVALASD